MLGPAARDERRKTSIDESVVLLQEQRIRIVAQKEREVGGLTRDGTIGEQSHRGHQGEESIQRRMRKHVIERVVAGVVE